MKTIAFVIIAMLVGASPAATLHGEPNSTKSSGGCGSGEGGGGTGGGGGNKDNGCSGGGGGGVAH